MKLLRTIRFDGSDLRVFERAAEPDEWAVPGAFEFADGDAKQLTGKARQAFANGFLGLLTYGRATFATVAEADESDLRAIRDRLITLFVDNYGAPDRQAALDAAEQEIGFVADLCRESPVNTVFTVLRRIEDDGEIREQFRTIGAPVGEQLHARIWTVVDDEA